MAGYRAPAYAIGENNWISSSPLPYVAAKLSWAASSDPYTITDDFCQKLFGAAAEEMKSYFLTLEKWPKKSSERTLDDDYEPTLATNHSHFIKFFTPQRRQHLKDILNAAFAKAGKPIQKKRIRLYQLNLSYMDLDIQATQALKNFKQNRTEENWQSLRNIGRERQKLIASIPVFSGITPREFNVNLTDPLMVFHDTFEKASPGYWRKRQLCEGISTKTAAQGKCSLAANATANGLFADKSGLDVVPNAEYQLTFSAFFEDPSVSLGVKLRAYPKTFMGRSFKGQPEWKRHKIEFTVPPDVNVMSIFLSIDVPKDFKSKNEHVFIDEIMMRKKTF